MRPLDGEFHLFGGALDIRTGRPHTQGDPTAVTLAQIRVQMPFELARNHIGATDHQVLEAPVLPEVERSLGGVAEMAMGQLLAMRCRSIPLALPPNSETTRPRVQQFAVIDHLAHGEDVELHALLVGQEHPDGFVLLQHQLELAYRRRIVDHELGLHRL